MSNWPAAGRRDGASPSWDRSLLRNPIALLGLLSVFAAAAFLAQLTGCNVHELGHALVGSLLGWEVEMVNLCTPAGGSVVYSRVGNWAGNAQGYAGGVSAALFLFGAYVLVLPGVPSRGGARLGGSPASAQWSSSGPSW